MALVDVIVARRDVDHERPECVERRAVTDLLHSLDVHLDLLHGYVPRPLDHHLDIACPGPPSQLTQRVELRKLGTIARVVQAAGPQRVAE